MDNDFHSLDNRETAFQSDERTLLFARVTCHDGSNGHERPEGTGLMADYPNIARRWHPTRNGDSQPGDHRHAGKERVWLLCGGCPVCSERHQWDARVDNLTQYGDNSLCPFCTSKGPSFCSCRSVAKNERLVAEWHEDNPSPTTVALGNDKKHRWRCSDPTCLHVWDGEHP